MIKKVFIRPGCISCQNCERTCPQIFKVDGTSRVIGDDFEKYADSIFEAAKNCPVQVIAVESDESDQSVRKDQTFKSTLLEKKTLTHDVFEFTFSAPENKNFFPGQFANFFLHDRNGDFSRCYSIKSWENERIVFCIKILKEGRSGHTLANLPLGSPLKMCVGLGEFVLQDTPHQKLFIATGTGIAPIMAMLDVIPEETPKKLLFGLRSEKDIFYESELKQYKNLDTKIWISQPSEDFSGNKGRVSESLEKLKFDPNIKTEVYICGNPSMVKGALKILQAKNHPLMDIFYESFTHSAASKATAPSKFFFEKVKTALPWIRRSLLIASIMTPLLYFFPGKQSFLWDLSLWAVILLMLIRPLRDLFPKQPLFSALIPLRKELGIFSASVVASIALINYTAANFDFFSTYFSLAHWSFKDAKFWAHLGEITGIILLLTSNIWSQKTLGTKWKKIQRLSYVYFFSGALYVWLSFHKIMGLLGIIAVFSLTFFALFKKDSFYHQYTQNLSRIKYLKKYIPDNKIFEKYLIKIKSLKKYLPDRKAFEKHFVKFNGLKKFFLKK